LVSDLFNDGNFSAMVVIASTDAKQPCRILPLAARLESHLFHLLAVVDVLADRGIHLLQIRSGFLYRGSLLAGAATSTSADDES
jgi:hypothetical protein